MGYYEKLTDVLAALTLVPGLLVLMAAFAVLVIGVYVFSYVLPLLAVLILIVSLLNLSIGGVMLAFLLAAVGSLFYYLYFVDSRQLPTLTELPAYILQKI